MTYDTILVETHGRVALIGSNRLQAQNALNSAVLTALVAKCPGVWTGQ